MSERWTNGGGFLVLHPEKMGRQNRAVLQMGCYGSRGVVLLCPAPKHGQTGLVYENDMLTKERFIKVLYRCSNREASGHRRSSVHLSASDFRGRASIEMPRNRNLALTKRYRLTKVQLKNCRLVQLRIMALLHAGSSEPEHEVQGEPVAAARALVECRLGE